jgi:beta-N-acetylhexosaminidase
VAACVAGFGDSGTLCTLKHFPGHGDTASDSHYGAVSVEKTLQELEACELLPFRAGIEAGAPCIMVGHISLPEVTGDTLPATLSFEIVSCLLRGELGFEGLIITDSMSMGAITEHYDSAEAAVLALRAGVDVILMPQSLSGAVEGILEALESGELSQTRIDESVLRILETKLRSGIIQ